MSLYIESVKRQRSCKKCGIELKKGTLYARVYDKSHGGIAFCSKCILEKAIQLLKEKSDETGTSFSLSGEDVHKIKELFPTK